MSAAPGAAGSLLAEASDPRTPPERLEHLCRGARAELRRALASNPSTPAGSLIALIDQHPYEVVNNPVWALLAMADPRLGEQAASLEARHSCDQERLRALASVRRCRAALAVNPAAGPELLASLAAQSARDEHELRALVASHPGCPAATLRALAGPLALDVARLETVKAVAAHPATPPEVLTMLARHQQNDVRERVAGNRSTPPDTLRDLADDRDPALRLVLAGNPSAPADVLDRLAGDHEWHVRAAAAAHPATPDTVLERLLDDSSQHVRRAAIVNPTLPAEALARLAAARGPDAMLARFTLRDRGPGVSGKASKPEVRPTRTKR